MAAWTPEQWGIFFGAVAVLVGAIATAAVTVINALRGVSAKVDALQIKVDGRLTQLLERTASASKGEGVEIGRGQMATVPIPPVSATVDPSQVQEDGTMVIGLPTPVPPVLLVPINNGEEKP